MNLGGGDSADVLELANTALKAYSRSHSEDPQEQDDLDNQMDKLKEKTANYIGKIGSTQNMTNKIVGSDLLRFQMFKADSDDSTADFMDNAMENGLSVANLTICLRSMRAYYNLSENESINIVKTDTDPSLMDGQSRNTVAKSVEINLYAEGKKLNMSVCESDTISIKIPLTNSTSLNSTQYNEFKSKGVDLFDSEDPFFNSVCVSYPLDNYDTTVEMRRKKYYSNNSLTCGEGCDYIGVEDNYVQCDCLGADVNDLPVVNAMTVLYDTVSGLNFGLVLCTDRAFDVYIGLTFRD
jgi:hypothetical protein